MISRETLLAKKNVAEEEGKRRGIEVLWRYTQ
jgi:hypothetical protein